MKRIEKHKMNKYLLILLFIGSASIAQDKKEEKLKEKALNESTNLTWEGNKSLSEDNFVSAEVDYRRAIAKSEENNAAPYNLGNAYYNKETYSEAFGRFKQAGELANGKADKHKAYHNMGNVFMKQKQYEKAVEAYKEALRNNPKDEETRYNLALAKELLKKEQEEQEKNDENKDNQDQKDKQDQDQKNDGDNKEDNKDQDESDKKDEGDEGDKGEEKKEDNKEGDGDKKEEEKKQPEKGDQPQEQKQQPRPNQLSKQQIQNLLEAMQNEEKKVQEKIDAQKVKGAKVKNEKDW
ncbi:tetratricopeptide repeat protein [Maribacter sp. HTCC2170]|uniref:tetratricopeptide repeat protein n=1 Tax=Maribacter sp. (strain HTCC2170 / KCCM 42371) TaxID=313603 RepID=UPI00006BD355|nr:tetratricopeptide repeat protein [Maribacter sp. HTCC2170]EAR02956.1 aerotolerance-related exported protein [Maribacter sp. HTCC2170]